MSVYSDGDGAFKSKVKDLFNEEGIEHITTRNHANIIERFIRTLQNGIFDRVRNTDRKLQDILPLVINKYNNTIHSSTGLTPNDAHTDNNRVSVATNLAIHSINKRKYPSLSIGSKVKYIQRDTVIIRVEKKQQADGQIIFIQSLRLIEICY
jgi:hypothetical protein